MSALLVPIAIHGVRAVRGGIENDGAALALGVVGVIAFSSVMHRRGRGSRSVVTDNGFHRTAITRSSPSKPFAHFRKHGLVRGQVLDFGSGRGGDCGGSEVRCYDPHHPQAPVRQLPRGPFDTVAAIYVANVLPREQRHAALRQAATRVKKGGHLLLAARAQGDQGYQTARSQWTKQGDGFVQREPSGELHRFQRFYSGDNALRQEVARVLGTGFRALPLPTLGSETAIAAFQRVR